MTNSKRDINPAHNLQLSQHFIPVTAAVNWVIKIILKKKSLQKNFLTFPKLQSIERTYQ